MSGSNHCFLTCIQVSQEAGKVVWYSHLFKNFPQFVVIYTVKGFVIVNEAEVDVFLEISHLEESTDIHSSIDESQKHYAYWIKISTKEYMQYDIIYMEF